jgi:hypothetical protein
MDADPGVERFDPPGDDVQRAALARTPAGFVVAVQTAAGEPAQGFKLTDACALVPSFGSAGFAALQFGAASLTIVRDVAVDGDGNIFVAGGSAVAVGSRKPDGKINTGFGAGSGFLPASPAMPNVAGLAPRPGGGVFFNGGSSAAWSTGFFSTDGSLVNSRFIGFGPGTHIAGGVAAGDGDVFATGRTPAGTTGVARKDGDTLADVISFDSDGKNDFGPNSTGLDIQFVPGGVLVLSGSGRAAPAADADFTIHRVDAAGGGLLGTTTTDFSGQDPAPVETTEPPPPPPVEPPPPPPAVEFAEDRCPQPAFMTGAPDDGRPCHDVSVATLIGHFGARLVPPDLFPFRTHRDRRLGIELTVRNAGPDLARSVALDIVLVRPSPDVEVDVLFAHVRSAVRRDRDGRNLVGFGTQDCEPEELSRPADPDLSERVGYTRFRCRIGDLPVGMSVEISLETTGRLVTEGPLFGAFASAFADRGWEIKPANNNSRPMFELTDPGAQIDDRALRELRTARRGRIVGTARRADGDDTDARAALVRRSGRARVAQRGKPSCRWLRNPQAKFARRKPAGRVCDRPVWLRAKLRGERFSYTIRRRLPCGRYTLLTRATNTARATEARFSRRDGNRADLRLC